MKALRIRSAIFFIQYLVLLLAALACMQFEFLRRRVGGHLGLFYLLIGAALCYLAVRAYLVLVRGVSRRWDFISLSVDLGIITGAVYLSGGINSEAGLVYFWPIATSSVQRLPRRTAAVSIASALLYLLATWQDRHNEKYLGTIVFRLVLLTVVTLLAVYYALTETALMEEAARLREKVAIADYRERLSREMHDGIQHYLADIAVRLELARRMLAKDIGQAARVAIDQRFVVRRAAAELRYLVRALRSPTVEREGFVEALRHHLSLSLESSSISAPIEVEGDVRALPPDVAQAAFRIVQEAIMNAEKHAQATEVKTTLSYSSDLFRCTIKDNGVGFDPSAEPETPGFGGGFGLSSMRQRAASVGGEFEVAAAPGQGTQVAFTVSLGQNGSAV